MYIWSGEFHQFTSSLASRTTETHAVGAREQNIESDVITIQDNSQGNIDDILERHCYWSSRPFVVVINKINHDRENVVTAENAALWAAAHTAAEVPAEVQEPVPVYDDLLAQ